MTHPKIRQLWNSIPQHLIERHPRCDVDALRLDIMLALRDPLRGVVSSLASRLAPISEPVHFAYEGYVFTVYVARARNASEDAAPWDLQVSISALPDAAGRKFFPHPAAADAVVMALCDTSSVRFVFEHGTNRVVLRSAPCDCISNDIRIMSIINTYAK